MSLRFLRHFHRVLPLPDLVPWPERGTLSAVFKVQNTAPEDAPETIAVLIDVVKEEVPQLHERFTEWFAGYLSGQGLDVSSDRTIRDLHEVKTISATWFQEYRHQLRNESRAEALNEEGTEGLEPGPEQGGAQERAEGQIAEGFAVARQLLEGNETVAEVADLTGLSSVEVAKPVQEG